MTEPRRYLIDCSEHGRVRTAFCCIHLGETLLDGVARGVYWNYVDEHDCFDAFCTACEGRRAEDGFIEGLTKADTTIMCEHCLGRVREINGLT